MGKSLEAPKGRHGLKLCVVGHEDGVKVAHGLVQAVEVHGKEPGGRQKAAMALFKTQKFMEKSLEAAKRPPRSCTVRGYTWG